MGLACYVIVFISYQTKLTSTFRTLPLIWLVKEPVPDRIGGMYKNQNTPNLRADDMA